MKNFFRILAILAVLFVMPSCDKSGQTPDSPLHEKPQPKPEPVQPSRGLSILFIGNSFTMDSVSHLPGMLSAAGIKDVHMVHMYYGGRLVQQYYQGWKTSSDYTKYECGPGSTVWTTTKNQNLSQVAAGKQWDIVVIQEHTGSKYAWAWNDAAKANFEGLIKCVKDCQNKTPKFYYLLSQAYQDNEKIGNGSKPNVTWTDHKGMWEVVAAFGKKVMVSLPFDGIISTGAMLENLRTTSLNNDLGLTRDGYHMDNGLARYGASCTIFETIFTPIYNITLDKNTYRYNVNAVGTTPVTDANAPVALEAARQAIKYPYTIIKIN